MQNTNACVYIATVLKVKCLSYLNFTQMSKNYVFKQLGLDEDTN